MSQILKPPAPLSSTKNEISIFLAGSIEMGKAEDWQSKIQIVFQNEAVTLYNPRRDDWDSTWKQTLDCENFVEQVEWELDALEKSDIIILYLDPNTKSPVSLLEFGLHARGGKLIVFCPEGFWRKGNVDVTGRYYNVKRVESFDELIALTQNRVNQIRQRRKLSCMASGAMALVATYFLYKWIQKS